MGGRGASILDQSHCPMNESRPVSSFITFSFHLTVAEGNVRKFGKLSPFFLFYFRFTGSRGRFSPYRGEWNRCYCGLLSTALSHFFNEYKQKRKKLRFLAYFLRKNLKNCRRKNNELWVRRRLQMTKIARR